MAKRTTEPNGHSAWYHQPVVWLGVLIFGLSMAGCVWMIAVSLRHDETPRHGAARTILGVPAPTTSSEPGT